MHIGFHLNVLSTIGRVSISPIDFGIQPRNRHFHIMISIIKIVSLIHLLINSILSFKIFEQNLKTPTLSKIFFAIRSLKLILCKGNYWGKFPFRVVKYSNFWWHRPDQHYLYSVSQFRWLSRRKWRSNREAIIKCFHRTRVCLLSWKRFSSLLKYKALLGVHITHSVYSQPFCFFQRTIR